MTDTNTAEREAIIRAAVAAMPHTNPLVADDLLGGFTMHTEADDIVAIFQAGRASLAVSAGSEPDNAFPLASKIYKRGEEWVLEVSGTINDCHFTCRHTQPGNLQPEDVAGLPTLYPHPSPPEGMAGWISVDERLPQPFTPVLIHPRPTDYCCEGEVNTQRQWSYGEYETGFGHHQIKCKVTHWQPLPAPPLPASEAKEL